LNEHMLLVVVCGLLYTWELSQGYVRLFVQFQILSLNKSQLK
jgi:hypothetical protein